MLMSKVVQNNPKLKLERFRYRQAIRILIKMAYEKENSQKIQPSGVQSQKTGPGGASRSGTPLRHIFGSEIEFSPYIYLLITTCVFLIYTFKPYKTIHFLKPLLEGVNLEKSDFDLVHFPGISGHFRLVSFKWAQLLIFWFGYRLTKKVSLI